MAIGVTRLSLTLKYQMIEKMSDELPLSLKQEKIAFDQLYDFTKDLIQSSGSKFSKSKSLIASRKAPEGQLVSVRVLILYEFLGLNFAKTHRFFYFEQEAIFKVFISTNISLRNATRTKFEQDLFKLMSTSL